MKDEWAIVPPKQVLTPGTRRTSQIPYCLSFLSFCTIRLVCSEQSGGKPITDKEGPSMSRLIAGMIGAVTSVVLNGSLALANAPAGGGAPDYSGVTGLYYTLIGLILVYGVYDAFFKKS